jgi:lipopolysaccharide transport system ATP-binding protein
LDYRTARYRERSLKAVLGHLFSARPLPRVDNVHALDGITLHVKSGERVGLIGRNGAGKTSLLKTVAGLYPISSGAVRVEGAIRALFDLSLGFEPEATGRENILYRGLLLGQSPRHMRGREAEIVRFADLGEFIDYPLKTYSAGMQVRLAFSISTAIPGDILLLDEVIAAGDLEFMVKARARIRDMIGKAKILLLASHDLSTLQAICTRVVWIEHGNLKFDGHPGEAIARYRAAAADATSVAAAP